MNQTQLRDYVYGLLQESTSTPVLWQKAEINRYLNSGMYKMFTWISNQFEAFFLTATTMSETAGESRYQLPNDTFRVVFLERILGDVNVPYFLTHITVTPSNLMAWRAQSGSIGAGAPIVPGEAYYQEGNKAVNLVNASDVARTNSLRLTYIFRPLAMGSDTHVPFSKEDLSSPGDPLAGEPQDQLVEFHDLIALYATEMALIKEESTELFQMVKSQRMERLAELKDHIFAMNIQSPRTINYNLHVEDF